MKKKDTIFLIFAWVYYIAMGTSVISGLILVFAGIWTMAKAIERIGHD